jgi:hypothetical protein
MKNILIRLLVAAGLTLVVFGLPSTRRHRIVEDSSALPFTAGQQDSARRTDVSADLRPSKDEFAPNSDDQTQEALAFTGHVQAEKGVLVLRDPITKISYVLDDQSRVKQLLGRHVKVIGKLLMRSNTIRIERVERLN